MATLTALHHTAAPRLPLPPSPSAYKNGATPRRIGSSRKTWTISAPVTPLDPQPVIAWRQSVNLGGGAGGFGGEGAEQPPSARRTTYRTLPASPKPSPNSVAPRPRPRPRPRVQPPREPQYPHQRHSFAGSPVDNDDDPTSQRERQHSNRWSSATPTFPPAASPFAAFSPPPVRRADLSPIHPLRSHPMSRPTSACVATTPGHGMRELSRPASAMFAATFPPASDEPVTSFTLGAAPATVSNHRRGAGSEDSAATGSTLAGASQGLVSKGHSVTVSVSSIGSGSVTIVGDPPKGRRRSSPTSSVVSCATAAAPPPPPEAEDAAPAPVVHTAPAAARRRRRRHHAERTPQQSPPRGQARRAPSGEDDDDNGGGGGCGLGTALRSCWPGGGGGGGAARDRGRERAAAVAAVLRVEQLRRMEAARDKGARAVVVERGNGSRQ
jgi:hypothetical protein